MKKECIFFCVLLMLFVNFSLVIAQNETASSTQVDDAYSCLEKKVIGKCSSLPLEDQIFSLLAIDECKNEVIAASQGSGNCWPSSSACNLKTTSQAILALSKTSQDTTKAENWLLSRNISPSDIVWYLQIDSLKAAKCTISYRGEEPHSINLNEDKTISKSAGSCLTLSSDSLFLKVSPGCVGEKFDVICNESFQTNLLFKRQNSNVWYLSGKTNPFSGGGTSSETVKSACFVNSENKCDYEGSLWAAFVLKNKGYDIKSYIPYLIVLADDNRKFLPEAFLYALTTEEQYKTELKLMQKGSENSGYYWQEIEKFYDTAVALLPMSDEFTEKTNAKNYLLSIQIKTGDDKGCFPTTVKNNAFLLASIWPKPSTTSPPTCTNVGYCVSMASCADADILISYSCSLGSYVCCKSEPPPVDCEDQNGVICDSGETCSDGQITSAANTDLCCIGGTCQTPPPESDCEQADGVCEYSCQTDEVEDTQYTCADYTDICCVKAPNPISWWIWVLIVLIILVVLGIIFRKKIQIFVRKGPTFITPGPRPGPPRPGMPPMVMERHIQRRIIQPALQRAPAPQPVRKPAELDDVLRKLKEMGK